MAKSKYETHVLPNLDKIIKWAKDGATAKEIAANLHIAYSTFRKYLDEGQEGDERYAALSAAFAQACEVPDEQVENALFKSCLGYNAQIVKHYKLKTVEYDPETGKRIREVETLVEARDEVHVSANTAAQMFWLTNRKPETWKYKPEAQDGDEDEEVYETTCPNCEETVFFDEDVLNDGEVICPNCGEKLEFDLGDLEEDEEDGGDEE